MNEARKTKWKRSNEMENWVDVIMLIWNGGVDLGT